MDYQLIETFIVISEVKNLTRASEILYKTQPTISNRIQQLENILGYSLLIREKGKQQIELTRRGEIFLKSAKKFFEIYNTLQGESTVISSNLNITSISSYQFPLVCNVCKIIADNSDISYSLYTYQTEDAYTLISKKKLDLAIVSSFKEKESVFCDPIFSQKYFAIRYCSSPNPIETIDVASLDPNQEIYQKWNDEFQHWHDKVFKNRSPRIEVDSYNVLKDIFLSKPYWTIMQESNIAILQKEIPLQIYKISTPPPERKGFVLTNHFADKKTIPLIKKFKSLLQQEVEKYRITDNYTQRSTCEK